MTFLRRFHIRAALLVSVALAAVAVGAGLAFAKSTKPPVASPTGGIVLIDTNLAYQGSAAAGTGMVLTSSGEVLTNNHVIKGATTIRVVVPSTHRSYTATVLGYSIPNDVALLQLQNASGLKTVTLGNSAQVKLHQAVHAVGNAGGTGYLSTARGTITGLGKAITASDENGNSERLTGLIETNAPIRPGDSGGPLLDVSNRVIGMTTAGSVGSWNVSYRVGADDAYAIPINKALTVVKQVESKKETTAVHIGGTPFVGVQLSSGPGYGYGDTGGVAIAGVVDGTPAAQAGLAEGDVITAIDGKTVAAPTDVQTILQAHHPGDTVSIDFTDAYGNAQTASLTLASGPPQ